VHGRLGCERVGESSLLYRWEGTNGALDDKSAVVAILEGAEKLLGQNHRPLRTIYSKRAAGLVVAR